MLRETWKEYRPTEALPREDWAPLQSLKLWKSSAALKKIKERVEDLIESRKDDLRRALIPATNQSLDELLPMIKRMAKASLTIPYKMKESMVWCPCTKLGPRVYFVLLLLKDITTTFKDAGGPLSYISLGSGSLLQDYITFIELMHAGYRNFELNFVELLFPDIPLLARTEEERIDRFHQAYLEERYSPEEMAQILEFFKTKVAQN